MIKAEQLDNQEIRVTFEGSRIGQEAANIIAELADTDAEQCVKFFEHLIVLAKRFDPLTRLVVGECFRHVGNDIGIGGDAKLDFAYLLSLNGD